MPTAPPQMLSGRASHRSTVNEISTSSSMRPNPATPYRAFRSTVRGNDGFTAARKFDLNSLAQSLRWGPVALDPRSVLRFKQMGCRVYAPLVPLAGGLRQSISLSPFVHLLSHAKWALPGLSCYTCKQYSLDPSTCHVAQAIPAQADEISARLLPCL